jgi:DNA mismatch repair protein MSH5
MAAIGALLDHIVQERALADFDDDGIGGLDINDIEIIALYFSLFSFDLKL